MPLGQFSPLTYEEWVKFRNILNDLKSFIETSTDKDISEKLKPIYNEIELIYYGNI